MNRELPDTQLDGSDVLERREHFHLAFGPPRRVRAVDHQHWVGHLLGGIEECGPARHVCEAMNSRFNHKVQRCPQGSVIVTECHNTAKLNVQ